MIKDIDMSEYVDTKWVASKTGYTTANITQKVRNGEIKPALRRGRKFFFLPTIIDELICVK